MQITRTKSFQTFHGHAVSDRKSVTFGWMGQHHAALDELAFKTHVVQDPEALPDTQSKWAYTLGYLLKPQHLLRIQDANQLSDVYLNNQSHTSHVIKMEPLMKPDWQPNYKVSRHQKLRENGSQVSDQPSSVSSGARQRDRKKPFLPWYVYSKERKHASIRAFEREWPVEAMVAHKPNVIRSIQQYYRQVLTIMKEVQNGFPSTKLEANDSGELDLSQFNRLRHRLKEDLLESIGHLNHVLGDLYSPFHATHYGFSWQTAPRLQSDLPTTGVPDQKAEPLHPKAQFLSSMHGFTEISAFRPAGQPDQGLAMIEGWGRTKTHVDVGVVPMNYETLPRWAMHEAQKTHLKLYALAQAHRRAVETCRRRDIPIDEKDLRYLEILRQQVTPILQSQLIKVPKAITQVLYSVWNEAGRADLGKLDRDLHPN